MYSALRSRGDAAIIYTSIKDRSVARSVARNVFTLIPSHLLHLIKNGQLRINEAVDTILLACFFFAIQLSSRRYTCDALLEAHL